MYIVILLGAIFLYFLWRIWNSVQRRDPLPMEWPMLVFAVMLIISRYIHLFLKLKTAGAVILFVLVTFGSVFLSLKVSKAYDKWCEEKKKTEV